MKRVAIGCGVAVLVVAGGAWRLVHDMYHPRMALLLEVPMLKTPPPEGATELCFDPWGFDGKIEAVLPPGMYVLSVRFVPDEGAAGGPARIVATAEDVHREERIDCSADGLATKLEEYTNGQRQVAARAGKRLLPYPWTHIGTGDPASAVWYLWPIYDIRGATAHRRGFTFHVGPTDMGPHEGGLPEGTWYARVERYIDAL